MIIQQKAVTKTTAAATKKRSQKSSQKRVNVNKERNEQHQQQQHQQRTRKYSYHMKVSSNTKLLHHKASSSHKQHNLPIMLRSSSKICYEFKG
jgi:hypothetical protein